MASSVVGTKANFSTRSLSTREPVVSVDWLHANLREPDLKMLDASHTLLPADELKKRFDQEAISLESPIVTSCGTGVTACILALVCIDLGSMMLQSMMDLGLNGVLILKHLFTLHQYGSLGQCTWHEECLVHFSDYDERDCI